VIPNSFQDLSYLDGLPAFLVSFWLLVIPKSVLV
jgi:hypothetical protein